MGQTGESCDQVCENHGEECMTTEHWMWVNTGRKWFTDAGINCLNKDPNYNGKCNPQYEVSTSKCSGYLNVPKVFHCSANESVFCC